MCDAELQMLKKRCEAYRRACAFKEEQVKILEAQVRVQEQTEKKLLKILNNGYIKNLMNQLGITVPERSAKVFLMNQ